MRNPDIYKVIDQYINQLPPERLNMVVEFLAYLSKKESEDATEELLNIPGFIQSFEKGRQDIAKGEITSCEKLKRKYR